VKYRCDLSPSTGKADSPFYVYKLAPFQIRHPTNFLIVPKWLMLNNIDNYCHRVSTQLQLTNISISGIHLAVRQTLKITAVVKAEMCHWVDVISLHVETKTTHFVTLKQNWCKYTVVGGYRPSCRQWTEGILRHSTEREGTGYEPRWKRVKLSISASEYRYRKQSVWVSEKKIFNPLS
jgi:hypothetical protein